MFVATSYKPLHYYLSRHPLAAARLVSNTPFIDPIVDVLLGICLAAAATDYKLWLCYLPVAAAVRATTDARTGLVTCHRHALHYKVVLQYMADYVCRHDTTKSWLGYRISDDAIADIVQR